MIQGWGKCVWLEFLDENRNTEGVCQMKREQFYSLEYGIKRA